MKAISIVSVFFLGLFGFTACSDNSDAPSKAKDSEKNEEVVAVDSVDYSAGRAMNKRLGKGINLGNSWDSDGSQWDVDGSKTGAKGDCGWDNCIQDDDFKIIAEAGFNSVRLPVRWHIDSDYKTHTVHPGRLAGVKEDIQLAIKNGLSVIVNFHHYTTLNDLGGKAGSKDESAKKAFEAEKEHFLALWEQVAKEMDSFPDDKLVLEILNEPTIASADIVNDLTLSAYEVIRKNAPKKTIMIEAYHAGKFADLEVLTLPKDGNIIFSGHYYEPYEYSHEGHSNYACKGDLTYEVNMVKDLESYVSLANSLYPDKNGGHVPMNMGEFGVAFGSRSKCGESGPTDAKGSLWATKAINAAEAKELSWHYWCFTSCGGFEAYDRKNKKWYPGFPKAFGL